MLSEKEGHKLSLGVLQESLCEPEAAISMLHIILKIAYLQFIWTFI